MLLFARSHLLVTVVKRFVARAGAVLASFLAVCVRPAVMLPLFKSALGPSRRCKQRGGRRPKHAQQVSTNHGQSPVVRGEPDLISAPMACKTRA